MVLLGAVSFGLGRLSVGEDNSEPIHVCAQVFESLPQPISAVGEGSEQGLQTGQYVASKNGSVYHFPWCSGAQRINDENKIWFDTADAARAAGYRPAANCKGL